MVLLSETLSMSAAILTIWVGYFNIISTVAREGKIPGFNRRFSACAASIHSLPLTYLAAFILLEKEPSSSVVAIYFTIFILNLSYVTKGAWTLRNWALRVISACLALLIVTSYFYFTGVGEIKPIVQKFDRRLSWYHPLFIWISSYRFFFISLLLNNAIYQRNDSLSTVREISIRSVIGLIRIALMWVFLKGTRAIPVARSPWGALDEILLKSNSLLHITFTVITILMFFDILSAVIFCEDDDKFSWNEMKAIAGRKFKYTFQKFGWRNEGSFVSSSVVSDEEFGPNNYRNHELIEIDIDDQLDGQEEVVGTPEPEKEDAFSDLNVDNLDNRDDIDDFENEVDVKVEEEQNLDAGAEEINLTHVD